ncbi:unnamed protein product [Closterium sp. NIES-54]
MEEDIDEGGEEEEEEEGEGTGTGGFEGREGGEGGGERWDVESMRKGVAGVAADVAVVMTVFCRAYAHLLLVLDDEEFYQRQIPFSLSEQRVIAATLNTLVYNTLISSPSSASSSASSPLTPSQSALLEAATRCLLPLHDRDCRRAFCEPSLWLAPADRCPPPVISAAGAARHHGVGGEGGGGMGAMMGRGEVDWEMGEWMGELGMGGGAGGRGGELGGEGGVMMAGGGRERGGVEKGKEQQSGSAMAAVLRTLPHVLPFEKRYGELLRRKGKVR